jgi:hypothetical protein
VRLSGHLRVSGVGGGIALANQNVPARNPVHRESGVRSGVRIAVLLAALLARSFEFGRCDVPVRPAFPGDSAQVLAEILQSGPAEGPVDVVNDKTRLTPHRGTESCKFAFSH